MANKHKIALYYNGVNDCGTLDSIISSVDRVFDIKVLFLLSNFISLKTQKLATKYNIITIPYKRDSVDKTSNLLKFLKLKNVFFFDDYLNITENYSNEFNVHVIKMTTNEKVLKSLGSSSKDLIYNSIYNPESTATSEGFSIIKVKGGEASFVTRKFLKIDKTENTISLHKKIIDMFEKYGAFRMNECLIKGNGKSENNSDNIELDIELQKKVHSVFMLPAVRTVVKKFLEEIYVDLKKVVDIEKGLLIKFEEGEIVVSFCLLGTDKYSIKFSYEDVQLFISMGKSTKYHQPSLKHEDYKLISNVVKGHLTKALVRKQIKFSSTSYL